jgi:hypothetical protein
MMDLNNVRRKPVSIQVKRKATEDDGQSDEGPLFRRHERKGLTLQRVKIFERATEVVGIGLGGTFGGCEGVRGGNLSLGTGLL